MDFDFASNTTGGLLDFDFHSNLIGGLMDVGDFPDDVPSSLQMEIEWDNVYVSSSSLSSTSSSYQSNLENQ